jgi:hypothetical protein
MRISPSPLSRSWKNKPLFGGTGIPEIGNVLASAKFPSAKVTSSTDAVAGLDDAP